MLNRFLEIIRKRSFISRMPKTLILSICIFIPFSFAVPLFFSIKIVKSPDTGYYFRQISDPYSDFVLYYGQFLFLFETIIPIIVLFILSVVSVYKFRVRMQIHSTLSMDQARAKKAEFRFTKMTLTLSTICIISRILDMITSLLFRMTSLNIKLFTTYDSTILHLLKSITDLILCSVKAFDGIIYLKMDKNIWKLILKTFTSKKVTIFYLYLKL